MLKLEENLEENHVLTWEYCCMHMHEVATNNSRIIMQINEKKQQVIQILYDLY